MIPWFWMTLECISVFDAYVSQELTKLGNKVTAQNYEVLFRNKLNI